MKHIVIYNQKMKSKALDELLTLIKNTFEVKQLSYHIFASTSKEHTSSIIKACKQACRIYICGGDGTLHSCIKDLVYRDHELVLLPFGTGNDFSRMMIDKKDPKAHFLHSFDHQARAIDVMQINDYYGINTACFGFDADIANHVHDSTISIGPKSLTYLTTALKRVFAYQSNEVVIKVDGNIFYQGKIFFATINNACYYGGGYKFTPKAQVDDGILDLFIIKDFPRLQVLYKIFPVVLQNPWILKDTITTTGKVIEVISKQGVNIDGETYELKNFKIQAIPKALKLVNPLMN